MAYIYAITNKINGKQYVGKTNYNDPQKRFKEHFKESRKERNENRPLHRAINKYGEEAFEFEVLEEVSSEQSCEREIYWIDNLETYGSTGYNATRGGDGKSYLDHKKILKDYNLLQNATATAKINNCHEDSVRNILKANNIILPKGGNIDNPKRSWKTKKVGQYSKEGELLREFDSYLQAANWLIENGFSKAQPKHIVSNISKVCRGKENRKYAYNFIWKNL